MVLEGFTLPHAYTFKYLGFWVSADGDTWQGMEKRLEQAADRFRVLGKVWRAAEIGGKLKLRIYVAGVLSVAAYSSECWVLGEKEERYLQAWNARRLAVITGRSIREEYQHPVRSLVGLIRRRRLQWLGRVLRERRDSLVGRCAMEAAQQSKKGDGSVFQDVPGWVEVQELVEAAEDGGWWKELMDSV